MSNYGPSVAQCIQDVLAADRIATAPAGRRGGRDERAAAEDERAVVTVVRAYSLVRPLRLREHALERQRLGALRFPAAVGDRDEHRLLLEVVALEPRRAEEAEQLRTVRHRDRRRHHLCSLSSSSFGRQRGENDCNKQGGKHLPRVPVAQPATHPLAGCLSSLQPRTTARACGAAPRSPDPRKLRSVQSKKNTGQCERRSRFAVHLTLLERR